VAGFRNAIQKTSNAGRIRREHTDKRMGVSHETIYRFIMQAAREGISYEKYLRQGRRRHTYGWRGKKRFKRIRDYRKIGERLAGVEERKEFGHWESDTLRGPCRQEAGIATHVERKTRFLVAVKLEDRKAETYNRRTIYAYLVRYPPFFPLFCDLCERRKKNPSQRKDD